MLLLIILFALFSVLITYIIQITSHEIGHMIAGAITGWKLVYLQIYHITFSKSVKYGFKIVPTTGYQCIMYPKDINSNSELYTLGGIISNMTLSCFGIYLMIKFFSSPFLFLFFLSLFASGFALILTNGIPHINNVCNDMACFILNRKHDVTKYCHNAQLLIAEQLFSGITYRDIDKRLICLSYINPNNDILAYHFVLNYYYHLDRDEYASAKAAIEKVYLNKDISVDVQKIIRLEKLYFEIMMDIISCNNLLMHNLDFTNDIESYIKQNESKGSIHFLRVLGLWEAYKMYLGGDIVASTECIDKTILKLNNTEFIYRGELVFCVDHLEGIKNIMIHSHQMKQTDQ